MKPAPLYEVRWGKGGRGWRRFIGIRAARQYARACRARGGANVQLWRSEKNGRSWKRVKRLKV